MPIIVRINGGVLVFIGCLLCMSVCFYDVCTYLPTGIDQKPRFPNIGYLSSAYDIFKGNPHRTEGPDQGLQLLPVFEFTYALDKTTADGRYSIPDNSVELQSPTCSFDFSSHSAQNTATYFSLCK